MPTKEQQPFQTEMFDVFIVVVFFKSSVSGYAGGQIVSGL